MRIEQDDASKNGHGAKNGRTTKSFLIEATTQGRGDNSVERSLEDFIAKANSTFLEGWEVKVDPPKPEPKLEPKPEPKVEAKPEPKAEAKAEAKAEPKAEAKAEAKAATPVAPVERTEVVRRDKIAPPVVQTKIVTRTNWAGVVGAFLGGAALVFGVMKVTGGEQQSAPPAATSAAAVPTEPAPRPTITPAPAPTPVVEARPEVTPVAPTEPPAPVIQPLEPTPVVEAKPVEAKPEAKVETKPEPKKPVEAKKPAEPKTVKPKGGIVDPFDSAAPAPKPEKKKPAKKKDSAPKGGIVDPFAM